MLHIPPPNVPIVTGATAITNATKGATFILVFNEAIWMGTHLEHSLLNPNQMRHHGITVQDNPYANESLQLQALDDEFSNPLQNGGIIIVFNTRTPTAHELATCAHVVLSSPAPWNPCDVQQFPTHHDEEGETIMHEIARLSMFDLSTLDFKRISVSRALADRLVSPVRVNEVHTNDSTGLDVPLVRIFTSKERHIGVSAKELSEQWFIGLAQAHNTIKVTTQNCTRSALLPLSRRYCSDRVFEKPLLRGDFKMDTMDVRSKSLDDNRYAQIIANKDFFAVAYLTTNKSNAGESLLCFIHEYGRPEKLTRTVRSQDRVHGKCSKICDRLPYRPNHNFADGVVREIRKNGSM